MTGFLYKYMISIYSLGLAWFEYYRCDITVIITFFQIFPLTFSDLTENPK